MCERPARFRENQRAARLYGGEAVSGLEQIQNAQRMSWSHDEANTRRRQIMSDIHEKCCVYGDDGRGGVNNVRRRRALPGGRLSTVRPSVDKGQNWPIRAPSTGRRGTGNRLVNSLLAPHARV
ncbi:MAG: hypothetical protein O3A25_05375 [Acidobacteria bacterium]|nr:hypothetical protein [Acidobacteriota bacterium]